MLYLLGSGRWRRALASAPRAREGHCGHVLHFRMLRGMGRSPALSGEALASAEAFLELLFCEVWRCFWRGFMASSTSVQH